LSGAADLQSVRLEHIHGRKSKERIVLQFVLDSRQIRPFDNFGSQSPHGQRKARDGRPIESVFQLIVGELFGVTEENRKKGLEQLVITGMRNEVVETTGGWTVINDAYNASPTSMRAALELLGSLSGYKKKIAVLGDMLELGDMEKTFHHEIGQYVKGKNVDYVFTFGELGMEIAKGAQEVMEPVRVKPFMNKQELTMELLPLLEAGDVVIVKGSRGMKLEEVIEGIK
jgi:UDP-N-acetylmuramoyl-tripeptide--D-alanyl-D-alanine ligase